ncbi:MAG: metallophosphoesterase [Alphaproteobacteria bacterium]|nr:MAG: metallophosphoesterase [Alphaproteobacteria bacterium]
MPAVLKLPKNTKGRDFVVGDIHGAYDLLDKALEEVNFDPAKDRLISVGDLIDRGKDSRRCLEYLEQPWFYALRGNHEDIFMDMCYKDGRLNIAKANFNARRNGASWLKKENAEFRKKMKAAFEKLPLAMEVETDRGTVGFVHAEVPENMDWQTFLKQLKAGDPETVETALWGRRRAEESDNSEIDGIDRVFSGHTVSEGHALKLGNCFNLDTGAVYREKYGEEAEGCGMTIADIKAAGRAITKPVSKPVNAVTRLPSHPDKPFFKRKPKSF